MGLAGIRMGDIKKIIESVENFAEQQAAQLLVNRKVVQTPAQANVRDVLPDQDLGLSTRSWEFDLSSGTANAENTIIGQLQLPDTKSIVIYGVKVIDPGPATFIQFYKGPGNGDLKGYIDLAKVDPETGVAPLETPIGYEPNSYLKVTAYITAQGTVKIALLAKVAEPKSNSIVKL